MGSFLNDCIERIVNPPVDPSQQAAPSAADQDGSATSKRDRASVDKETSEDSTTDDFNAGGKRGNERVETVEDTIYIDIVIDRDFDSYSEEEQKRLLKAIEQFLGVGGELRVTQKRRGSVKLRVELSPELAERLLWAAKSGEFSEFGVIDGELVEGSGPADTGEVKGQRHPSDMIGNYRLLQTIGQGAFGTVYLATDPVLERRVAVKFIRSESSSMNIRSAQLIARLEHPGIVPVLHAGQTDDGFYTVMPYVEGRTLDQQMRETKLSLSQTTHVISSVAAALDYLHSHRVLHRNIKPSNIIIDSTGHAQLIDFGLAIDMQNQSEGEIAGTLAYMAPEQLTGQQLGSATDIWALGVILYELLTGRLPFASTSFEKMHQELLQRDPRPPRLLDSSIPKELDRICLKALSKSPENRYSSATALASAVRVAVEERKSSFLTRILRFVGLMWKKSDDDA